MAENFEEEIHDTLDLLTVSLSKEFMDRWKFKYGERLVRLFQIKLLDTLRKQKVLKLKILFRFLTKDSGFSSDIVKNFLEDIDFSLYSPIISGSYRDLQVEL